MHGDTSPTAPHPALDDHARVEARRSVRLDGPIVIGLWSDVVPRPCASAASEARVALLVDKLFAGLGDDGKTIADVAREAGLEHETVRRRRRNPGSVYRTSPGFFVVAALARARGLSLDWLAAETLDDASEPRQP